MYFVKKFDWKLFVPLSLAACLLVSITVTRFTQKYLAGNIAELTNSFASELYYIPLFVIGAVLAKYRRQMTERLKGLSRAVNLIAILYALIFFAFRWIFYKIHSPRLSRRNLTGVAEDLAWRPALPCFSLSF